MKLFTKYNRINLAVTIVIFLLAGIAFYFSLRYVLIRQVDENMMAKQHEIENFINKNNKLPEPVLVNDMQIIYQPAKNIIKKHHFKSIVLDDVVEKERGVFRQLTFTVSVEGKLYEASISESLEGTDDLTQSVISITLATILLILIAAFLINRIVLKRLWQPFYSTVNTLKKFKLGQKNAINFPANNIEEFSLLNQTLQLVVDKAEQEYLLLKEFTENASHELQTPLAIIRSKLDLLVQDENLSQQQSDAVVSANEALQKLARLNQSLLLLAKIENQQFTATTTIYLKEKIENKLQEFRELWQAKNIKITTQLEDFSITMNNDLIDILLNNLFNNATRHNLQNGEIAIQLHHNTLKIYNTGLMQPLDSSKLFTRFYKQEQTTNYHGLGLSIVKQICEVSGCTINYQFIDNKHQFTVVFQQIK